MKTKQFIVAAVFCFAANLVHGTTDAKFTVSDGTCVLPGDPGSSCDDGDAGTFNDVYLSDSCTCAGTHYVNPDGSGPCEGTEFVSYKGYDYRLVEVGSQCWYQENVRELPSVSPRSEGYEDDGLAHAYVNGYTGSDTLEAQQTSAYVTFGPLYNFAAVEQWSLCPSGFHVPELSNFNQIISEFGNAAGGMLKEVGTTTSGGTWLEPNTEATNALGFEAKAGGHRLSDQSFTWQGYYAYFWASSSTPLYARLDWNEAGMFTDGYDYPIGMSVRCVKGVLGCTDTGACNYNPDATTDDASCVMPSSEGMACDDGDANTYNDVYLADGCTCAGTSYVNPDGTGPCAGASHITYDGYDYRLVEIGTQCWYQENVRQLPAVFSPAQTFPTYDTVDPRAWVYGYDGTDVDSALTLSTYQEFGPLYNHAAATQWNLCPSGWNLPSVGEWTTLLDTLGGVDEAAPALKASAGWDGTNAVGFEALPAGQRNLYTGFNGLNEAAYYWTSTTGDFPYAFAVSLSSNEAPVGVGSTGNHDGFSIRCVKGVPGCTNAGACNYDAGATLDDGTCVLPGDPGSSCDDGDAGTFNDVYLSDSCTCAGTHYVNPDGSGPCEGTEFVSYKGYDYRLVEVGSQCWYQENVRELPSVSPRSEGYEDDGLAHAYVNGYTGSDTLEAQQTSAYVTFGPLYNFAAVEQWSLCPSGFHVPELSNFNQIISEFGNAAGGMLKEVGTTTSGGTWLEPNTEATNALGFEAKAGGHRLSDQSFTWQGYYAYFWASSSTPLYARLDWNEAGMFTDGYDYPIGMSVRCVKGVLGCTDTGACNYNPDATTDDASCVMPSSEGMACDDGDANTYNDVYLADGCTCAGTSYVNPDGTGPCAGASHITYDGYDYRLVEIGTQCWYQENVRQLPAVFSPAQTFPTYDTVDPRAWVYGYDGTDVDSALTLSTYQEFGPLYNHAAATQWNLCPSGWNLPSVGEWTTLLDTLGGVDEAAPALKASAGWDGTNAVGFEALPAGQRNLYTGFNGLNEAAYYWTSTTGDFPYAFAVSLSSNEAPVGVGSTGNHDGFSIRCVKGVPGCTNAGACNYDAGATLDDGTCILEGCNDPSACNFNGADICDLTCIYPLVGEDCNGVEGMCGPGTYWNATEQQCEVSLPGDTDFDNCVGVTDLLGLLSVFGVCQEIGAVEFDCGVDKASYQGYDYTTVQIGDQCWFAENCKYLPEVSPGDVGSEDEANEPHAYVYGYYGSDVDEAKTFAGRYDAYGVLYNHFAAEEWQLCPTGWHQPYAQDFRDLEISLGLPPELVAMGGGLNGTDIGTKLKAIGFGNGSNTSGFSFLGAGYREVSGNFHSLDFSGHQRAIAADQSIPPNGSGIEVNSGWTGIGRMNTYVNKGFSVRCIKDAD